MDERPKYFYEFGDFRVEAEECRLLRRGEVVALTPRVFDILLALITNSGQTVEKEKLLEIVWPDTFVEESNLHHHVSTLRKVLGDDAHTQELIKTIPRRGYRFTGNVRCVVDEKTDRLKVETLSRRTLVVTEETHEGFWTIPRIAALAVVLVGATFFGAWSLYRTRGVAGADPPAERKSYRHEAEKAYRDGRALWQTRNPTDLHGATLLLEEAVRTDPGFALAHAALADAYVFDYTNKDKAEAEAREAIRLDPTLGEPHATIGFLRMFWQWKLTQAAEEFEEAVRLSPDYATAHQWFAANLAAGGHGESALAEIKRALELDPASLPVNADMCQILYFNRRYEEALSQCKKTLEMDSRFLNADIYLYDTYTAMGRYREAIDEFAEIDNLNYKSLQLRFGNSKTVRDLFSKAGIRKVWQDQIESLLSPIPQCYQLAQYCARLGDKEGALHWLDQAYRIHQFEFVTFQADPVFDELRGDQRYHDLAAALL